MTDEVIDNITSKMDELGIFEDFKEMTIFNEVLKHNVTTGFGINPGMLLQLTSDEIKSKNTIITRLNNMASKGLLFKLTVGNLTLYSTCVFREIFKKVFNINDEQELNAAILKHEEVIVEKYLKYKKLFGV